MWVTPAVVVAASAPASASASPSGDDLIVYSAQLSSADGGYPAEGRLKVSFGGVQGKSGGTITSATVSIASTPGTLGAITVPIQNQDTSVSWVVTSIGPNSYVISVAGISASYVAGFTLYIDAPAGESDILAGSLAMSGFGTLNGVSTNMDMSPVGNNGPGGFTYAP